MPAFIWIHHPGTGGVALQPEAAVAELWEPKGWTRVHIDLVAAGAALGNPVADVAQVPESYVRRIATPPAPAPVPPPAPPQPETTARRRAREA